jgi:hypothetical protein
MTEKKLYYIIITYEGKFVCFVAKHSTSNGNINFTYNIDEARVKNTEWGRWFYRQFIKKIINTLRDFDEIIEHPNTIIMKGKTFEDVQYIKDKNTLTNIKEFFNNYNIKKLRVEYDITKYDLRKWKIMEILDE